MPSRSSEPDVDKAVLASLKEYAALLHFVAALLAALLAARGFVCRAGGQLIIFLAANEDMIDGEFKLEPRSLGNTLHGLEYLEKARWGRWRRYGPTEVVPTDSEQLKELKKVRAKNSAKGGACAQPNPSPIRVPNPSSHSPCLCVPTHAMCLRRQEGQGRARQREERHRHQDREVDRQEDK